MCVSRQIQELLAAVFIWWWGQYTEGFADKKNAPQLNVLDRGGSTGFGLWCMGIHCVGRNTSACGRTDLLMSKWGRSFIMHKCVRACLCVSRTHVCVEFILGGRFYIEVVQCNYLCTEEHLEEAVIERSTKNTLCANSSHAWKSESAPHLTRATLGQCCPI